MSKVVEPTVTPLAARRARSTYGSTVLRFYRSTVLRFYGSTVLRFYGSTVLPFYGSTVLRSRRCCLWPQQEARKATFGCVLSFLCFCYNWLWFDLKGGRFWFRSLLMLLCKQYANVLLISIFSSRYSNQHYHYLYRLEAMGESCS